MASAIKVEVAQDAAELAELAVRLIVGAAQEAIEKRGVFRLVLAGGGTPKATYELLASAEWRARIDWAKTQIFWGDERMVPPDDVRSNYRMAQEALLSKLDIAKSNIFRMRGELEPEEVEQDYLDQLESAFGDEPITFDLVLLGMGADGHTASIFPDSPAMVERRKAVSANYVAEMDSWRLTFTRPVLAAARQLAYLVAGKGKAERVRQVLEETETFAEELPSAAMLNEAKGEVVWLLDREAASSLVGKSEGDQR